MKLNFYIDGKLVGACNDWQKLNIELSFDNEEVQPTITTEEFEFVLDTNNDIIAWISAGLYNGVGIYEPPSYKIELVNGSNLTLFEGLLDLQNIKILDCNKLQVKVKKTDGVNKLTERSQAISFAYLANIGEITTSDYVNIPYVLYGIPNYVEVALSGVSIFVLVKELKENIKDIAYLTAEVSALLVTGLTGSIAGAILTVLKLIAKAVYIAAMIVALKTMIENLINNLISPVRYYKGMYLKTLLEKGATHLGYTFESTVFNDANWQKLIILPAKEDRPDRVTDTGFPSNKDAFYTYYDLLQVFKQLINGKIKLIGNKIKIERKDFWEKSGLYSMPDVYLQEYRYNAPEIASNFNLQFMIDATEQTTVNNYKVNKSTFQRITKPKNVKNKKNVTLAGLEQITIPLALPTRKENLTDVEKVILSIAKAVDSVLSVFGSNKRYSQKITNRIGMLFLSNDLMGVAKIIPFDGSKIKSNYRSIMNAEVLYNNYYFINTFSQEVKNYSQYKIYEDITIPFCFEDYTKVIDNSYFTKKGVVCKFDKIEGNPDGNSAVATWREKYTYTKNLKDVII